MHTTLNKNKPNCIKHFFQTYYRELLFFILLASTFLSTLPDELHGWNSGWYAMDYSLGFDSRLLIGSLLHLFYPDFLPAAVAYNFVILSTLVLLAVLSYVLGHALRRTAGSKSAAGLMVLITFYLLCPSSPAYLWSPENMGRFDLYLFLMTLIAAIACFHIRLVPVRLTLFTLCGVIALSIHQAYLFTFFPLLFTLYIVTIPQEPEASSLSKTPLYPVNYRRLAATALCMGILGVTFLYFQFFSHIHADSCQELTALLEARTDLPVSEVALRYEYFTGIAQSAQDLMLNLLHERIRYAAITFLLLSPLAFLYGWVWHRILKTAAALSRRQLPAGQKIPFAHNLLLSRYLPILLSQLLFLPAFLLTIDWGRWFGAFLTIQALQLVILAAQKDTVILSVLEQLNATACKHPLPFLCTAIWLGALQKFQATLLPNAPTFFTSLYKLSHILLP